MFTENENAAAGTNESNETAAPAKKTATKKPAKKAGKKVAKKATKKAVKKAAEPKGPVVVSASSVKEGVREITKAGHKKGLLKVNGKTYAFTLRTTWGFTKSVVELDGAKDGIVMIIKGKGHYVYPKKDFTELFGKMFKTDSWKVGGYYSMSIFPVSHEEYFSK